MPKLSEESLIYIPTWGRLRIHTIEGMSEDLQQRVRLVVNAKWGERLSEVYPQIQQCRCEVTTGAADAKQWILDHAEKGPLTIILDDDLAFQQGVWEDKKRFRLATAANIDAAFQELSAKTLVRNTGFTSCSSTFFNTKQERWGLCKQICGAFFINRDTLAKTGATFGGIPTREDVHFSAKTWAAGYPSYSLMDFAATNKGNSALGGESSIDPETGRTSPGVLPRGPRTEQAHRQLALAYPNYIELITRVNKRTLDVGCTTDIRVHGVRMYCAAIRRLGRIEQ